jgi:hypothetical protein
MNPAPLDLLGRTAVPSGNTRCARLAAFLRLRRERGFVVSEYRLVVEDGEA